jgi:hypothetical protein
MQLNSRIRFIYKTKLYCVTICFIYLVLSSMVRNGDAHLKNFGVLYPAVMETRRERLRSCLQCCRRPETANPP